MAQRAREAGREPKKRGRGLPIALLAVLVGVGVALYAYSSRKPPAQEATPPAREGAAAPAVKMVSVPAGDFFKGCNEKVDDECLNDERPGRKVPLDAFRIDRTEVTVADYRACVSAARCSADGLMTAYWEGSEHPEWARYCNWDQSNKENDPINCVTWDEAVAYCAWRGKRLPSEDEWEKAARGINGQKYPWGSNGYGPARRLANIADESARSVFTGWSIASGYTDGYVDTAPVGSFPEGASPYGALDMIGNVSEWVGDSVGNGRALRGGAWNSPPKEARASYRHWDLADARYPLLGFRCAK